MAHRDEPWATRYDLGALLDPIWNHRTLCGRGWIEMEPGEGTTLWRLGTGVYAPHCRNCLRILSSGLEGIAPDERIPLVVGLIVTEVLAEAWTVVTGVPGEQLESLRAAIRQRFRSLGVPCRTYPVGGDLHVFSEQQWDNMPPDRKSELGARAATAISDAIQGLEAPKRGIAWDMWGVI